MTYQGYTNAATFGIATQKDDDKWNVEARTIFAKYPEAIAVVVDCHI